MIQRVAAYEQPTLVSALPSSAQVHETSIRGAHEVR